MQDVRENDLQVLRDYKHNINPSASIFLIEPEEDLDPEYPTGLRFNQLAMIGWIRKGELTAQQVMDAHQVIV